jgi:hypothetical protein
VAGRQLKPFRSFPSINGPNLLMTPSSSCSQHSKVIRRYSDGIGLTCGAAGGFKKSCLHERFAYSNLVDGVASISVGLFDGMGKITQMDNLEINHPNPDGGRMETSLPFNSGTYEVYANGRGVMHASFGAEGGPYYDPPASVEFVVTNPMEIVR